MPFSRLVAIFLRNLLALVESENIYWNSVLAVLRIVIAFFYDLFTRQKYDRNDAHKTPSEIVISNGYAFEEHKIFTPDGNINTAWRIPRRLSEPLRTSPRIAVFQHGLMDNSFTWLI